MGRIAILMLGVLAVAASDATAQAQPVDSLEARVWLDRGEEPVVQRGDEVRVYYRTSADAYVAIFRIDTDGAISLLFPQHPGMDVAVRGGRDYRLMFPRSARWRVEEDPGAGYFFMVASPEPLDFSLLEFDPDYGWDLSAVGATVYDDPYVAIDQYVAAIVPDWEYVPYALDFLTYNVGDTHEYPRFLCYDCHGFQSYARWNPYGSVCSTYRVVIWDDPYFYPRFRYVGTRVVFARPLGPRPRYGVVTRAPGSGWAPLVRTRAAPPRRVVEYKEPARAPSYRPVNPSPRGAVSPPKAPGTRRAIPSGTGPPSATLRSGGRAPAAGARPSDARSGRAAPSGGRAAPPPARGGSAERPTLQRRPSARAPARAGPATRGTRTPGTTTRGATTRGTTNRGTAAPRGPVRRPGGAAPSRGAPSGAVRPPARSAPRATPQRTPARAGPRAAPARRPPPSSGRPAASRPPPRSGPPAAGSRRPSSGRSGARPARRPPPRGGTPTRRPGGRGG